MQTISINFILPTGWRDASDKQLRFVYELIAQDFEMDEVKTLLLLRWSGAKVIGRQDSGSYLLKYGSQLFEITPLTIAELTSHLDWLDTLPTYPVRPAKINRREALPATFEGVPFESFIVCDNFFQGYLYNEQEYMLDEIGHVLYDDPTIHFRPWHRVAIFYWMVALKDYLSKKYPDFFQTVVSQASKPYNYSTPASVEEAMNAQIRALTKGDVTKEAEVLALDTHRALTELNAQAREYKELNQQLNKK